MKMLDEWILSYSQKSMLKSVFKCHHPFFIAKPLIVAIYEPFKLVNMGRNAIETLKRNVLNIETPNQYLFINIFDDPVLVASTIGSFFTPNTYVFTKEGYPTKAVSLIQEEEADETLKIIKKFNLCCVVYYSKPMDRFELIQLNYEDSQKKYNN